MSMKKAGKLITCLLLCLVMVMTSPVAALADTTYYYDITGEGNDNDVVKYLYYKGSDGKYYRKAVKQIDLAPYTYYDTMYDLDVKKPAWENTSNQIAETEAAAEEVIQLLDELPVRSKITLADEDQINAAQAAFNALNGQAQNIVKNTPTYAKLTTALARIADLKADSDAYISYIKGILAQIPAISDASDVDTLSAAADSARIARLAYTDMSAQLKEDFDAAATEEEVNKLKTTETTAITTLISRLPDWYPNSDGQNLTEEEIAAADKAAEAALAIYRNLSDAQKQTVDVSKLGEVDNEDYNYTEENDTGSAISHSANETFKDVNVSFLDRMIKRYLLKDWAKLADRIFATSGETANYEGNSDYAKHYVGNSPSRGMNIANALASATGDKESDWGKGNAWRYTGLKSATSLSAVRNAMADEVRSGANRKAVDRSEILDKKELTIGKDRLEGLKSDDNTKAFYSIATYVDRSKWDSAITYESYGLCFYDFDLAVISDKDVEYVSNAEDYRYEADPITSAAKDSSTGVGYKNIGGGQNTTESYTENNSTEETEVNMSFSNTDSTTMETSFETSEEYSFSEMIGSETEIGAGLKLVNQHITVEFTAEQAFSTARGKTNSATSETNQTISTTLTIPAQTAVKILQEQSNSEITMRYNTPMAISFKVAIFSIGGEGTATGVSTNYIQDVAGYNTSDFYCMFGGASSEAGFSANENLHHRAVDNITIGGYDESYGKTVGYFNKVGGRKTSKDSINWQGQFTGDQLEAIRLMTEYVPMVPEGTGVKVTTKKLSSMVDGIVPLYRLKEVALGENVEDEYEMTVGDKFYLKSLSVDGLNKNGVPYYGFDPADGEWVLCKEDGQEMSSSEYVTMSGSDAVTGKNVLTAKEPGVQYLKWRLNDDVVKAKKYSGYKDKEAANNDNIDTAIVKVTISEKPFEGNVLLAGDYTGYVGDDPVLLTENGLKVKIKDATGKEVSRPVTWEARELDGIDLDPSGTVTFTEEGTYGVRVYTGTEEAARKYSDWVEIKAEPAKGLAKIIISDVKKPAVLAAFTLDDTDNKVDLSQLKTELKDQYGNPWTKNADLTWCVNGKEITGTVFEATKAGTYRITAKSGNIVSNALTLQVSDEWDNGVVTKAPTCTRNGVKTYTYKHDKTHKRTEVIKKLGHKWDDGKVKAAIEKTDGTITYTCQNDKKHKRVQKIPVFLLQSKAAKKAITLKWNKIPAADGYEVYFAKCSSTDSIEDCKLVKTYNNNKSLKYTVKGLKTKTPYKAVIKAYKLVGKKKVTIARTYMIHSITANQNKRFTNIRKLTVKKAKVSLKAGKAYKIPKAAIKKFKNKKKLINHEKTYRYATSNSKVATVSKAGKIKGIAAGKCKVYVIGVNGQRAAITVTVK